MRLKNRTASGVCNILPELLKYGGDSTLQWLLSVIVTAWQQEQAPPLFKRDVIIFLHKKGDSSQCTNHRTITLQSVVGKVYSSVIRARFVAWLEPQLLEVQAGFRPGRGCTDAVFVLRQLAEFSACKGKTLHCCFLDLQKAFDSVDRSTLFRILASRGAPPKLVALIKDLHADHHCAVRAERQQSKWFPVTTGVKQGDVLAPLLFNLYMDTVARQLLPQLQSLGVTVHYSIDGHLTRLSTPSHSMLLWLLMYADDAVLTTDCPLKLQSAVSAADAAFSDWGLTISVSKTKVMLIGATASSPPPTIMCQGQQLEVVDSFKYLGGMFSTNNSLDLEVAHRLQLAGHGFAQLNSFKFWRDSDLPLTFKMRIYVSVVLSILLYGCECWALLDSQLSRLEVFHMRCLRTICRVSLHSHIRNTVIRERCGVSSLQTIIRHRRLRWLGHIGRMPDLRLPKRMLFGEILATGRRGRPVTSWTKIVQADVHSISLPYVWYSQCQDRTEWKQLIAG